MDTKGSGGCRDELGGWDRRIHSALCETSEYSAGALLRAP